MKLKTGKRKVNRTAAGNVAVFLFLLLFGVFFLLPIVYAIATAFKPLNEIFIFPPRLIVKHPTTQNFLKLSQVLRDYFVPFSRYFFNSLFITVLGTVGHIILAGMAAYPMAKHRFYGQKTLNRLIVTALLFSSSVTYISQYIVLSATQMIDTYLAVILPALQTTLGLYLMMNFMKGLPDAMLEAARIDGAGEFYIFWHIVMPNVKPAWLTLMIFQVQALWNSSGGGFLYSEELKTLPSVLATIAAGGNVRAGVTAAASLIMMLPPIFLFVLLQSRVIETMSTSGMKD